MSGLVLGIDGGQTSTTAAVCDLGGRLVGLGRSGPANHVWEPGGRGRARRAVRTSISRAFRAAGLRRRVFDAAFLGMTGANGRTEAVVRDCVGARRLRLANDKVNALAAVTAGRPGIVVIAGTGTIAYGENARGQTADASGWGYLLGDEGGGFWIARRAIAAACRAHDGRGPRTALTEMLLAAAAASDMWGLHGLIYSHRLSRADIAGLAAAVPEAARAGDREARGILRAAGAELGLSASAVARRLNMHRRAATIGMVGGIFRMSGEVRARFRQRVRRSIPEAVFASPLFAPVMGSVLLALKLAGVRITRSVLANLKAASEGVGPK